MRILLAIGDFSNLTGAELYAFELGKELTALGEDFTIVAPHPGNEIGDRARAAGIHVFDLKDAGPGLGEFDILHLNEPQPTAICLAAFPGTPAVATIHSQWPCEQPIKDSRIQTYIAIREDIREKLINQDGIEPGRIQVVHNPIDFSRFNREGETPPGMGALIFVGTLDVLRKAAVRDAANRAYYQGREFWLIGQNHHFKPEDIPHNARVFEPTWNIEWATKAAAETAGILLGRTTIEGWACGKPGWIYSIDLHGRILKVERAEPPADMNPFDSRLVALRIREVYNKAREASRS